MLSLAARNLKYYPLALFRAMKEGKLSFIEKEFKVFPCQADSSKYWESKYFRDLSTWELLNLRPDTVLNLSRDLKEQFDITDQFLEDALKPYNIQSVGRDPLDKFHNINNIEKPMQYMLAKTRHYSWPKGMGMPPLTDTIMNDS